MALRIVEIHPAEGPELLNTEWFVLENAGERPFNTRNCTLVVQKKGVPKKTALGTIDPGFTLAPGERVRVVTGHPGRKAHGDMPAGEPKNYSLLLGAPVLRGTGTLLTLALRSLPVATAEHDPASPGGVVAKA